MPMEKKLTRAQQKALRPLQILDAAFEEFVKQGYSATRLEDVAERVGVTKGTIYVYFETKEKLFEAMIRHISGPLKTVLESADTLDGHATDRLRRFLELLYDQIVDNRTMRELIRFVIAEGAKFPDLVDRNHGEFIAPIIEKIQSLIEEGVAAGEFRRPSTEAADVTMGPMLAMIVIRLIYEDRQPLDQHGFREEHIRMILSGLTR